MHILVLKWREFCHGISRVRVFFQEVMISGTLQFLSWNVELYVQDHTGWEGSVGWTSPCSIASGLSATTPGSFLRTCCPPAQPSGPAWTWLVPARWGPSSLPLAFMWGLCWACPGQCQLPPGLCCLQTCCGCPVSPRDILQIIANGTKGEGALDRALKSSVCSCPSGGAGNINHCTFWAW